MAKAILLFLALQAAPDRLAPMLERWRSGTEDQRIQALRDAAALRAEVGDGALAAFVKPPLPESWTRSEELLEVVVREGIPSWSALAVPILKAADPRAAWAAAYALIQTGARERVAEIVPMLKDGSGSLRPNVLHVLRRLASREHGPQIVPFLDDADPEVAIAAVEILGRVCAGEYADRVARFLEAREPLHRQAAIESLASMNARDKAKKIAERLNDDQVLVRWEAIRALGRLKAREYSGQIVAMADDAMAPALEAMGSLGLRELAPHILPFLEIPEPGIRWRAVRALGSVDAKDDADRLAEMLKDPDSYVRLCTLQSLAAMGVKAHAADMLELLRDEETDVCQGAAEEASALVTAEQIRKIVPLLGDGDGVVRWSVIRLLVGADARAALPAIVEQLRSAGGVNREVVWAIGRLGGRDHRDAVAAALRNDDGFVRQQAAFALARISDRAEELEAAEKASSGAPRLAAGFALVRLGRKDRAAALSLLREFVVRREDPDYQRFPEEIFDALAAGFEKETAAALLKEVATSKRIESTTELEAVLAKAGVALALDGLPELRRRLPAGSAMTARRALEWSFGSELRLVPDKGRIRVLDTDRALELWKKRLDAP